MDQLNHAMMIANQVRVGRDIRHTFVERNGLGPHTPQEHRFHTLDGMRGIAALMVMAYHYYSRASLPFLRNTFIVVDFFFILSGFVITHAYASKLQGGMRGADYFVRRIARLLPTAVVGVLIGLPTLWLLIRNGHATYSLSDFVISTVSNLLMLPFLNEQSKFFDGPATVTGQLFPADDPLWSIFAELVASASFLILVPKH
jgi:peptidoglycan/LPS O-acetylase OafA/YrhL